MKIIELSAENIKRLRAVDITPDAHLQVIAGRNAAGKSSVLDAIWLALGGGAASKSTSKPIRDGETSARVRLDLGDLVVTRTWTGDKTTLTVTSKEGAKFSSPQKMLDDLIGRLSFDPLEFTRLSARDQVAALLDLVDLDIDIEAIASERQAAYDRRTEIGRQGKALGEIPAKVDAPAQEVSASDLIGKIREAQQLADDQDNETNELRIAEEKVAALKAEIEAWAPVTEMRAAKVKAHKPVPNVEALESSLQSVEETNRAVRANAESRAKQAQHTALYEQYATLSDQISAIDHTKAKALAAAKFPVDGLGFDDDGVTYQGVPFSQASSAEQIRVSLAMAMALNPKLRVIRILDGSLLDADNLALIGEMAAEHDYQVWLEKVGDGDGIGVVIEDGSVLAAKAVA